MAFIFSKVSQSIRQSCEDYSVSVRTEQAGDTLKTSTWALSSFLSPEQGPFFSLQVDGGWVRPAVELSGLPGSPVNQIYGLFPWAQPYRHWPHRFAILTCGKRMIWVHPPFRLVLYTIEIPLLSLLGRSLGSSVALMEDSSKGGAGQNILENHFASSLWWTSALCLLPLFLW